MSVYVLPYNSKQQLSPHFNAQELRCKCGGTHNITVDTDLLDKMEKIASIVADIEGVNSKEVHITVSSANRCKTHDINVGGDGYGMHTLGKAMDFQVTCEGKIVNTKLIACIAQEIGFTGIGRIPCTIGDYIHCDVGTLASHGCKKWLGDETVKGGTSGSVINEPQTYWDYYGLKRSDYFKDEKISLEKQLQTVLNEMGEKLVVDGIIGEKSLAALKKHNVNKGESGEFVKVVQEILNSKGYDCGKADGICGDKTAQAICNAMYDRLFE